MRLLIFVILSPFHSASFRILVKYFIWLCYLLGWCAIWKRVRSDKRIQIQPNGQKVWDLNSTNRTYSNRNGMPGVLLLILRQNTPNCLCPLAAYLFFHAHKSSGHCHNVPTNQMDKEQLNKSKCFHTLQFLIIIKYGYVGCRFLFYNTLPHCQCQWIKW